MTDENKTADNIDLVCKELAKFLRSKNIKYGDAALNPCKIFAKGEASELILVRIDDKLNRIINSDELRKNDIVDLTGYLVLFMISQGWIDFSEMID
ncbi:MAG: hypothetical protein ACTSQD_09950 [Promethearchaeota archaeon]